MKTAPIHIPTNSAQGFPYLHILTETCRFHFFLIFLIMIIQICMSWHLLVVLIYTFLIVSDTEQLFMCLLTIYMSLENVYQFCCCCCIDSVMSDSVRPHRRQPTRLPRSWDSPGKNTGVGWHFLLQSVLLPIFKSSFFSFDVLYEFFGILYKYQIGVTGIMCHLRPLFLYWFPVWMICPLI